ncbi:MAG: hypothetical protein V4726_22685 [Verrucomicrobiota bacterium]
MIQKPRRPLSVLGCAALGWLCSQLLLRALPDRPAASAVTLPLPREAAKSEDSLDAVLSSRAPLSAVTSLNSYRSRLAALAREGASLPGRQILAREALDSGLSPALMLALLQEKGRIRVPKPVLIRFFDQLARRSPSEAMALVDRCTKEDKLLPYDLGILRGAVNRIWLKNDPAAAVAHTRRMEAVPGSGHDVTGLMGDWSWVDCAAAMRALVTLTGTAPLDETAAYSPFSRWLRDDPAAAREWCAREAPESWRPCLEKLAFETVPVEPSTRLDDLEKLPSRPQDSQLAMAWTACMDRNPAEAAARINRLPPGSPLAPGGIWFRTAMDLEWKWVYEPKPKERLLQLVAGIGSEEVRDQLMAGFARHRLRSDFSLSASIAAEVRNPALRAEAYAHLVDGQVERDLHALTAWLDTLPQDPAREEAVVALVHDLAPLDPAAARAWADSLPPGSSSRANAESALRPPSPSKPE